LPAIGAEDVPVTAPPSEPVPGVLPVPITVVPVSVVPPLPLVVAEDVAPEVTVEPPRDVPEAGPTEVSRCTVPGAWTIPLMNM
jgi:hypothetical protein